MPDVTPANPIFTVTPPVVGDEYVDPWTLVTISNDLLDVGVYIVEIHFHSGNYPPPSPPIVVETLTVTVVDPCETAVLNSLG